MAFVVRVILLNTVKALSSPRLAYFISGGGHNREGGLLERGAYSQNQMTRICLVAFQLSYTIFCRINIQFLRLKYINATQFYPKPYQN